MFLILFWVTGTGTKSKGGGFIGKDWDIAMKGHKLD